MDDDNAPLLKRRGVPGPLVPERPMLKKRLVVLQNILMQHRIHAPVARKQPNLNPTQVEIIKWIMDGKRTEEIAELMGSTVPAIQQQVYRIMEITGTNTRVAVVIVAMRSGLIPLPVVDVDVRNHTNGEIPGACSMTRK